MTDVAIGIDIGTSYTKAAACTKDGTALAVYRRPSPQVSTGPFVDLRWVGAWWTGLKDVLHGLLFADSSQQLRVRSLCVSAIAPTLTVFDAAHPDSAYAILYSSPAELEDGSSLSQRDPRLTMRRLALLTSIARKERFVNPCITDLVGYVNWRLTGVLTINGISFNELGMIHGAQACDILGVVDNIRPKLVAVGEQIGETTLLSAVELGIESGIPVCGGCPDTMGSIVGAGLIRASETMLYLGTFGSILELDQDVNALLDTACCPSPTFRWVLSVPGLGPKIESLGRRWFGFANVLECLRALDLAALQAPPGAGGTLFLVPRWKNGMTAVGKYELVSNRSGEIGDIQIRARAVLEGIAYAALSVGANFGKLINVSGGGARSRIWCDIISTVLNRDVQVRHKAWESIGTADIAARMIWRATQAERPWYRFRGYRDVYREAINDNYRRIIEGYREYDWL